MKNILIITLTCYVGLVTAYIEYLNIKSDGRLPNREYYNGNPEEGVVTWRVALLPQNDRDLANNKLLACVSTFGLLQYIAAPCLVIVSIIMIKRHYKKGWHWPFASFSVGFVACVLMFYRAYFTSLGP